MNTKKIIAILLMLLCILPITVYAGPPDYNIEFPSIYEPQPRFDLTTYYYELIFRGSEDGGVTYNTYYFVTSNEPKYWPDIKDFTSYSSGLKWKLVQVFQNGEFQSQYWDPLNSTEFGQVDILSSNDIIWANFNVIDYKTYQEVFNTSSNPVDGDSQYFIKILLPGEDGYTDHQNKFVFWTYYKIPFSPEDDVGNISIQVTGGAGSYGSEILVNKIVKCDGYLEGYFNFVRPVNLGENEITVEVTAPNGLKVAAKRIVNYTEFADTDNDGLDDNTGQPEPVPEKVISDNTPDGTVLGYLKWAFENIMMIFSGLIDIISSLFLNTGYLADIMENFMSFLPWQVRNLLILSVTVTVILKIFKR